jgi:transcriptional regulator with XRE-family HTH domain
MARRNNLIEAPPYPVEAALKTLGVNLRRARNRRGFTIAEVAAKIGTGPRAVADAEKGKPSTGAAVYVALLWAFGLLDQLADVAAPTLDKEGAALALAHEHPRRRSQSEGEGLNNDF